MFEGPRTLHGRLEVDAHDVGIGAGLAGAQLLERRLALDDSEAARQIRRLDRDGARIDELALGGGVRP